MARAKINMFGEAGHPLNTEPFEIEIYEMREGKRATLCLEKGDRIVVVETL